MDDLFNLLERLERIEKKIDAKMGKRWVDLKAACEYCDLSAATLIRNKKSGRLKCSKPAGKLMFKIEWLDKWMEG